MCAFTSGNYQETSIKTLLPSSELFFDTKFDSVRKHTCAYSEFLKKSNRFPYRVTTGLVNNGIEVPQDLEFALGCTEHWSTCPNTRFMMAILSVIFTLLSLSESILLILDMNLISTLKFRIIIAGLKWIPLWTSTWVYAWGMCSSIHITYSKIPNGTLGRLVGCKLSAVAFNMTVVGSLTLALMYEATTLIFAGCGLLNRIDSFLRIFARFEMMATHYDPANFTVQSTLLPELPGLLEMTLSVEDWRRDFCFLLYACMDFLFHLRRNHLNDPIYMSSGAIRKCQRAGHAVNRNSNYEQLHLCLHRVTFELDILDKVAFEFLKRIARAQVVGLLDTFATCSRAS
ncbi:hypothetical protein PSTT_01614 [Puccinia striiformis]|uniref:Uncharacterized protein n=1 Tax=Puccinia striiformis TaxID=27350 RepID=A0A2S4W2U1_9BASI|nr:hypothetical protein PSTT_01614 [Puccinia striiformis]